MADMTAEALQGYEAAEDARCPFLATSDSFNAWCVGRAMAEQGWNKPTPGAAMADKNRASVSNGRGNLVIVRGYKATLIAKFRVEPNGDVNETR